ncbi:centromere protein U [Corythoichthys intestinalis]|uniref:centromere protein U n=1 Tax=Corythoichthys intestinalis TaxID=161448 RepID=UPI0025A534B3|nr:centromere protein U [Corythoichthys intestinalis]
MSTRKGRRTRKVPAAPVGNQKISLDSGNQSSIDGASFIKGLQQQNGDCMHSTAIEEDENNQIVKRRVGKNITETVKGLNKTSEQAKMKKKSSSASRRANVSQVESDSDSKFKRRPNKVLSSDDDTDEDTSYRPSPKKVKKSSLERISTKLSKAHKVVRDQKKKEKPKGETELDMVLDSFLDFCDEYRHSIESNAVKQTIDCFSNKVKEQLLEKIASFKELKVLKRENAKVCAKIRTATQKLLDAKEELIRAERQVSLLQKEKADLELRLQDLQRSQTFLRDIVELNKVYLDYRSAHPKEKETV